MTISRKVTGLINTSPHILRYQLRSEKNHSSGSLRCINASKYAYPQDYSRLVTVEREFEVSEGKPIGAWIVPDASHLLAIRHPGHGIVLVTPEHQIMALEVAAKEATGLI